MNTGLSHINLVRGTVLAATLLQLVGCGSGITTVHSAFQTTTTTQPAPTQTAPTQTATASGATPFALVLPALGSAGSLGNVAATTPSGVLTVLRPTISTSSSPLVFVSGSSTSTATSQTETLTYTLGGATVHVTLTMASTAQSASLHITSDTTAITAVDAGQFAPDAPRKALPVPYFSGTFFEIQESNLFGAAWWEAAGSNASNASGTSVLYALKTDGTRNTLSDTLDFTLASDADAALPSVGNAPSPFRATTAGRLVLDIWDSGFTSIGQSSANLSALGLKNCVALVHVWQNQGYDNGLPGHVPANPGLGGDTDLVPALNDFRNAGCLVGLHQNYTDYYPNFAGFSSSDLALTSSRSPIPTWLNPNNVQATEAKPGRMAALAAPQLAIMQTAYKTTASFIDVNSSVSPWSRTDMDASASNGGKAQAWMQGAAGLWAAERSSNAGPVFGEGNQHWYYSGMLDGVEAQLGSGFAMNTGRNLPLFVDFDILRIHSLQNNHGMGYYSRWTSSASSSMSTADWDAYRTQEIAFGHAPYLQTPYWSDPRQLATEQGLVSPAATAYGSQDGTSIAYLNGTSWVDTSTAIQQSSPMTQVRVQYSAGLQVTANSGAEDLALPSITLPQFGWLAQGNNLLAYTGYCQQTICDYSQTPTAVFANARNQADALRDGAVAEAAACGTSLSVSGGFQMSLCWKALAKLPAGLHVFIHYVPVPDAGAAPGDPVFQGDYTPSPDTSSWVPGNPLLPEVVAGAAPSSLAPGPYTVLVGLYSPTTGIRYPLYGANDGSMRYTVATLTVDANHHVSNIVPVPFVPAPDPRMNNAGAVLSFPALSTDGMVSITREGASWVLRPQPTWRTVTVTVNSSAFPPPSSIYTDGIPQVVNPILHDGTWSLQVSGATSYTWDAP